MLNPSDVKKALTEFMTTEREIDNQVERLQTLETKLYTVGSPELTDMPRNPSPSNDWLAVLMQRKIKLEEKIDRMIAGQKEKRDVFEHVIELVATPDQRATIQMHYLDGQKWESVNDMLFGLEEDFTDKRDSYMRRVHILHGQALQQMAHIFDEKGTFKTVSVDRR